MNTPDITTLLAQYWNGEISHADLESLYRLFLNQPEIADRYPDEAKVIRPLALAYFARQGKERLVSQQSSPKPVRTINKWYKVAAIVLVLVGIGVVFNLIYFHPSHLVSNANITEQEFDEWFTNTMESAL